MVKARLYAHDDRKDHFTERDGVRCAGTHYIVDLFGAKRLDDLKLIKETLKRCVEVAGANLLHIHLAPAYGQGRRIRRGRAG